jgi:hypothetical protein
VKLIDKKVIRSIHTLLALLAKAAAEQARHYHFWLHFIPSSSTSKRLLKVYAKGERVEPRGMIQYTVRHGGQICTAEEDAGMKPVW